MTPPILFLVFNRPGPTAEVFRAIRQAAPSRLYVAADGPRPERGEDKSCDEARRIATNVDWPCEVRTLFRNQNLGCRRAVSEAITWFFSHEEEGIILEDDCRPNESFFRFAGSMLDRYRDSPNVMSVGGSCFFTPPWRKSDYAFTFYADMWGWATWRRAWRHYDVNMSSWRDGASHLDSVFERGESREYWRSLFDETFAGRIDTWDYQWIWTVIERNGLCVTPLVNMVENIGFGPEATHTKYSEWSIKNRPMVELGETIRHPAEIARNRTLERFIEVCRLGVPRRRILDRLRGKAMRALANNTTYAGRL